MVKLISRNKVNPAEMKCKKPAAQGQVAGECKVSKSAHQREGRAGEAGRGSSGDLRMMTNSAQQP